MSVTVSVVNYNTKDLTKNCLRSILNKKWQNEIVVWVVDNGSMDGSARLIKKEFPQVKLIENKKNIGFAAGHNLVLRQSESDFCLILNSDTLLSDGVIDEMVEFMKQNPSCGISSCKVWGFDGKLQPNGGDLPFGLALFSWLFNLESLGIGTSFHRNDAHYYDKVHEVGWVSGNFMFIKNKVFSKVGFFDEGYFMYFEDAQFCYRAKKGGFKVMLNPTVSIKHLSGGSLDKPKLRQWSGEYKGLIYFYKKQFGNQVALMVRILIYISTILRIFFFAIFGKLNFSKTYVEVIFNL